MSREAKSSVRNFTGRVFFTLPNLSADEIKKCTKPSQGHASPFLLDKGLDSIEAAGERVTIQFILFRDPYI